LEIFVLHFDRCF